MFEQTSALLQMQSAVLGNHFCLLTGRTVVIQQGAECFSPYECAGLANNLDLPLSASLLTHCCCTDSWCFHECSG